MRMSALPETQAAADEFARQQGMSADDLTLVESFKSKVANFTEMLDNLRTRQIDAVKYPDLASKRNNLISRGGVISRTIAAITGAVDRVFTFFKGVVGMDGMGIVPLLPIAAITVAVAAITKWTTDAYEFNRRLDAIKDLEAKGYPPERAGQIVNQQLPSTSIFSGFGGLGSLLPWVAVAGVVFFIWKGGKIK